MNLLYIIICMQILCCSKNKQIWHLVLKRNIDLSSEMFTWERVHDEGVKFHQKRIHIATVCQMLRNTSSYYTVLSIKSGLLRESPSISKCSTILPFHIVVLWNFIPVKGPGSWARCLGESSGKSKRKKLWIQIHQ